MSIEKERPRCPFQRLKAMPCCCFPAGSTPVSGSFLPLEGTSNYCVLSNKSSDNSSSNYIWGMVYYE